jgi:hypothetical protein
VNSVVTAGFLDRLGRLPGSVRQQASRAYALWRADPHHPSLQFERVSSRQPIYSARVGLGHRATGALGREHDHLVLDRLACRVRHTPRPAIGKDNRCQFVISGTFRGRSSFLDGFAGQARFDQSLGCRSDHLSGQRATLADLEQGPLVYSLCFFLPAAFLTTAPVGVRGIVPRPGIDGVSALTPAVPLHTNPKRARGLTQVLTAEWEKTLAHASG